jgi:hypothetical protein
VAMYMESMPSRKTTKDMENWIAGGGAVEEVSNCDDNRLHNETADHVCGGVQGSHLSLSTSQLLRWGVFALLRRGNNRGALLSRFGRLSLVAEDMSAQTDRRDLPSCVFVMGRVVPMRLNWNHHGRSEKGRCRPHAARSSCTNSPSHRYRSSAYGCGVDGR